MARIDKIDRLRSQLNVSGIQQSNNPLYQVINTLIDSVKELINSSSGSSSGGGGSVTNVNNNITNILSFLEDPGVEENYMLISSQNSEPTPPSSSVDHVVMSDGATPTPSPVDDGFGNFIYIEYTP